MSSVHYSIAKTAGAEATDPPDAPGSSGELRETSSCGLQGLWHCSLLEVGFLQAETPSLLAPANIIMLVCPPTPPPAPLTPSPAPPTIPAFYIRSV